MTTTEGGAVRRQLADELVSVTERLRECEAQLDTARTIIAERGRERDRYDEALTQIMTFCKDADRRRVMTETVLAIQQVVRDCWNPAEREIR